jgi:hypothetical protein
LISDVPRKALLEAMEEFDKELRGTEEWSGWEQKGTYKYAIVHDGQHYPVKQIISMATGEPKTTFSGGLLTKEDKLLDTLPKRAEAFLGWILYWEDEDYGGRIRDVYLKRNLLLHQGKRNNITEQDLAFTDHLLLNLLTDLVRHPKLFRSKEDVIAFSERVEAERVLGVKPKVRPKTFMFIRRFKPGF